MSEGFAGTVTIKLKPEEVEEFMEMALETANAMSHEKEFRYLSVHTVVGDPNTLFVFESWSCNYQYFVQELRNRPYRDRLNAALGRMTHEERQVVLLDNVASYSSR